MHEEIIKGDPISDDEQRRLSVLQTWDCQDNDIAVTTFGFLQHRRVDVFCRDRKWRSGKYVFTIDDYEGDFLTRRALIYQLDFTMKMKFFGPTGNQGVIREVNIDFNTGLQLIETPASFSSGHTGLFKIKRLFFFIQ